jgi:hypothetical protein
MVGLTSFAVYVALRFALFGALKSCKVRTGTRSKNRAAGRRVKMLSSNETVTCQLPSRHLHIFILLPVKSNPPRHPVDQTLGPKKPSPHSSTSLIPSTFAVAFRSIPSISWHDLVKKDQLRLVSGDIRLVLADFHSFCLLAGPRSAACRSTNQVSRTLSAASATGQNAQESCARSGDYINGIPGVAGLAWSALRWRWRGRCTRRFPKGQ